MNKNTKNRILCKMTTSEEETACRIVIQFCVQSGMSLEDTFKQMTCTERHSDASRQLIYKWHRQFREGWTDSVSRGRKPYEKHGNNECNVKMTLVRPGLHYHVGLDFS